MKKRLLSGILVFVLLLACLCPAALAAGEINVTVNGEAVVWTDVRPFIDENNRTLCPLRAVAETMGLDVTWDPAAREAIFSFTDSDLVSYSYTLSVCFPIDSSTAYMTEHFIDYEADEEYSDSFPIEMDTAAVIVDNRTYAPVRYLAESFGYNVDWDAATRTVLIEDYVYEAPMYWECFEITDDYVGIFFYPGETYDTVERFGVTTAMVNDIPATYEEFSEAECLALTDELGIEVVHAMRIYGDFRNLSGIDLYNVSWGYYMDFANGSMADIVGFSFA
ncbi:MAG: copper amine oxidase N-terminal domain-containing protein [Eubacteriales bacterium]|nr:copper amine oxidase N-terminal domain-containing protein [Eubacteriales bacterium]